MPLFLTGTPSLTCRILLLHYMGAPSFLKLIWLELTIKSLSLLTVFLRPPSPHPFQFLQMPFDLRNVAQSFQRFMDQVLCGLPFVYSYLDEILMASPTAEEHRANVSWVQLYPTSLVFMWTARESVLWRTRYKPSGTFPCRSHSAR